MQRLLGIVFASSLFACTPAAESQLRISAGQLPSADSPAPRSTVAFVKAKGDGLKSFCTATLIAPRLLLTAAHCLDGIKKADAFQVMFGASLADERKILRAVDSYQAFLPTGSQLFPNFDIAWVKLQEDAPAPWEAIEILRDEALLKSLEAKEDALLLAGYGRQAAVCENDDCSGKLLETRSKLRRSIQHAHFVHLFSIGPTPPHGVCNGDSGGPAFAQFEGRWFVLGNLNGSSARLNSAAIVDPAGVCGKGEAVFTYAGAYANWIEETSGIKLPGTSAPTPPLMDETSLTATSTLADFLDFNNYTTDPWLSANTLYEQFERPEFRIEPDFDPLLANSERAAAAMQTWKTFAATGVSFDFSTFKMTDKQLADLRPIGHLTSLENLELSGHRFRDTKALGQLKNLRSLRLGNNYDFKTKAPIPWDFAFLAEIPQLEQLDLSRNSKNIDLRTIPWEALRNLKKLNLSGNELTSPVGLEVLVNLEELDLSQNGITDFSLVEGLPKLQVLKKDDNPGQSSVR